MQTIVGDNAFDTALANGMALLVKFLSDHFGRSLRIRRFIKEVGRTYRYYLTHSGKEIIVAALKLKELVLIPQLAFSA